MSQIKSSFMIRLIPFSFVTKKMKNGSQISLGHPAPFDP